MERMRKLRADISEHDSVERFTKLGVDVFIGNGKFVGPNAIEVDGKALRFSRAVIATGARAERAADPRFVRDRLLHQRNDIHANGIAASSGGHRRRADRLRAGASFQRFGSVVTLITDGAEILPKEDRDAAAILRRQMEKDGVRIITGGKGSTRRNEGRVKAVNAERRR